MAATVVELWRYPVKSLLGEQLEEVELEKRGVVGDRLFAVTDGEGKLGSGKTSTRFRRLDGLFELHARSGAKSPLVTLPDGRELAAGDEELEEFLSERYGDRLHIARESAVPHHDAAPLHLLTTSSLQWLARELPASQVDRRRFVLTSCSTAQARASQRTSGWDAASRSARRSSSSATAQTAA
jgi:uncharacterized protein